MSEVTFAPNPFDNYLCIDGLPQLPDMKLSIYDLSGVEIYQKIISKENNSQLNITDLRLKPGVCIAVITTKKEKLCVKKLIIK